MMHDRGKSDCTIVAAKPTNNVGRGDRAECARRRGACPVLPFQDPGRGLKGQLS
jgi:hypothetical protein